MNCKKCGNPLEENDQFCKNCGAPVTEVSAQTNYGPTPKNSTLKFVLIFLGVAIFIASAIIGIAIMKAAEEDKDDVKTSKKKEVVVTEKDKDYEEEDEEILTPPTKSTYTVKSNGFTFKIPTDLVYETTNEGGNETISIGDEDGTWMLTITPIQGSYNQMLANKNQLQSLMIQEGYNVSEIVEKTYGGMPFIVMEISEGGQNGLLTISKANSMYVFLSTAVNIDNEFDYDMLEEVADILRTAEFNSETTNMKTVEGLNLDEISKLAQ